VICVLPYIIFVHLFMRLYQHSLKCWDYYYRKEWEDLKRFWNFMKYNFNCRSQWPRGLRCRFATTRFRRFWVRIQPGAWMSVCCERGMLSDRGLCDELITRPDQSYRLWCVVMCDLETSWMRGPGPTEGTVAPETKKSLITRPCRCTRWYPKYSGLVLPSLQQLW
jgi:hypothetical protein